MLAAFHKSSLGVDTATSNVLPCALTARARHIPVAVDTLTLHGRVVDFVVLAQVAPCALRGYLAHDKGVGRREWPRTRRLSWKVIHGAQVGRVRLVEAD